MKKFSWIFLGLFLLSCAIVFFPWFEILLLGVLIIAVGSYWHYWKTKAYYGPYLYYGSDPTTSMWINYILVSSSEIARKTDYFCEISKNFAFDPSVTTHFSPTRIVDEAGRTYINFLCEKLETNTRFFYRIGYLNGKLKSRRSFQFKTAKSSVPSIESFDLPKGSVSSYSGHFMIYGDDQTADFFPILAQITNHYQYAAHPEFIIHLGDINQNLWHDQENNAFFQTKRKIFMEIPYLPVIGNHDVKPLSRYNALYTLPHWYTVDYGLKLRILCLSGYDGFVPRTNGQFEFIETQLCMAVQENRFIIICVHETFFGIETNIPEEKPTLELRQYVLPLLRQYNRGLQRNILVFSGHIHEYCRIVQEDLNFFIVGACSNAKWYSDLQNDSNHSYNPKIAAKEYGRQSFALLTLQNEALMVEIRGWGKKVIESLEFRL